MPLSVYPKSRLALADAMVVAIAWLLLAMIPLSLLLTKSFPAGVGSLLVINFAAFMITGITHVVLSFSHECPSCGKHPTIQGFGAVHPNSIGQSALTGWSGVVVNILRRRQLICIYCGSEYNIGSHS
jgi:hypothetical protein